MFSEGFYINYLQYQAQCGSDKKIQSFWSESLFGHISILNQFRCHVPLKIDNITGKYDFESIYVHDSEMEVNLINKWERRIGIPIFTELSKRQILRSFMMTYRLF